MKIFFTPVYTKNPYQKKLMDELSKLDLEINIAKTGTSAFFKTESINEADIVHFHWIEPFLLGKNIIHTFLKGSFFLYKIAKFKKNKKFIWTVHNLSNHEKKFFFLERIFLFFFVKLMDGFSVHNLYSKEKLINIFKISANKVYIIPHGNYIGVYDSFHSNVLKFKKEILNVPSDKFTFMFLGNIRPYKGVLDLVKAFKEINLVDTQLLICGHISHVEDRKLIIDAIHDFPNIYLKSGYVTNDVMEGYLKSADVMLYPYKDIITSGALILGMSLGRPCLASNVGSMGELLDEKYLFNTNEELKEIMIQMKGLDSLELKIVGDTNYNKISFHSWLKMAEKTKNMYKSV